MDRENVQIVRDHIAGLPPEQFDMDDWGEAHTKCGTAACIGGWAAVLLLNADGYRVPDSEVAAALGLDIIEGRALFYPRGPMMQATIPQGLAVLDHLLATGEVDWSVAAKPELAITDGDAPMALGESLVVDVPPAYRHGPDAANPNNRRIHGPGGQIAKAYGFTPEEAVARADMIVAALNAAKVES